MILLMNKHNGSIFEKHPRLALLGIIIVLFSIVYEIFSVKWINNRYTEYENKNIKTILHQYYVGKIIDNNIGRFIKLREHRPHTVQWERPSRNYIKNNAPNGLERKYYKIATDKNGFIMPSDVHSTPDLRIVFLGGSTTECLYMEETERFPYLVGRELEKKLGKKINTYNGGVSANESMHSLNILINKVLPMKPDYVVMMHNINDLLILRSQGGYGYADSLKSHVQTSKNVFTRHQFPPSTISYDPEDLTEAFSRNLNMFISICRIHKIVPILMTQANRVDNDPLYHRFNEIICEVGKQEKVRVIDLANQIPSTADLFYDSYHYTAKGSRIAAEIIMTALVDEL
jgi:hypothetical protein